MDSIFVQNFEIGRNCVDCFGRLKPSMILYYAQEMGGRHCMELSLDYETLLQRRMFWAVTRHRVHVTRMPLCGETLRVETWPMPNTRVAFPRSVVAYDEKGQECFRIISLWVLMNLDTRSMILPGKSGITVGGTVTGTELALPGSLVPAQLERRSTRRVSYTDLDRNGHMNNTRYLEWVDDLFPSDFHRDYVVQDMTVCYLTESREGQTLDLHYDLLENNIIQVDAYRTPDPQRVFAAKLQYMPAEG